MLAKYRGRGRDALLPLLHEVQAIYGWLPREVLEAVGHTLHVPPPAEIEPHPLLEALRELDPDALSPREALEYLYALKKRLNET